MRLSFKNKLLLFLVSVFGNLHDVNAKGKVIRAPVEDRISGQWITRLKQGPGITDQAQMFSSVVQELTAEFPSVKLTKTFSDLLGGCFIAEMTPDEAEQLAENPLIDYIEENRVFRVPDDDYVGSGVGEDSGAFADIGSWGLDRIDQRDVVLDDKYEPFGEGDGVRAYIVDTGIRTSHNDFGGRAEWGTNTIDDVDDDCNGHGTHVAGTVGGKTYGVAKAVTLVAVKVLNCSGSGSITGILDAINWVISDAYVSGKPATANFSLGGGNSPSLNGAVAELHASGVVTVAAAGNNNSNACSTSPAGERSIITVGSTTTTDSRSSFSNHGDCVDIFAPGSAIQAPWIDNDDAVNTISGTSMASPHVCGVVAVLLGEFDEEDVPGIMMGSATKDKISDVRPGSPNKLLFVRSNNDPTLSPTTSEPTLSLVPSLEPSSCMGKYVIVEVTPDLYPSETTWTLENTCDDPSFITISGGPYSVGLTKHVTTLCVSGGEYGGYKFTINDSFEDGICCNFGEGMYTVRYDGIVIVSGDEFEGFEETTFGVCETAPSPTTSEPPVSSPTTTSPRTPEPTLSVVPSLVPSFLTTSPPVTRPPTANEPLPLSWEINYKSAEVKQDEVNPLIAVEYVISNRLFGVEVYSEDCKSLLPEGLLPVSTDHHDISEGMVDLLVGLEVDQTEIESDSIWTPDLGGDGGSFKFCLSTSLYKKDIEDDHRVTRKNLLFEVNVSNVLNFSAGGITVVVDELEEVDISIAFQGEVDVYQCNEQGEEITAVPIGPFDLLNVCVKVKEDENMKVTDFLHFVVKQGGFSFPAIQNGVIDDLDVDIVTKVCGLDYCRVSMQPVAAFFATPKALTVSGTVIVGDAQSRTVEQKEFNLTVMLIEESCKEGTGLMKTLRKVLNE